MTPSTANRRRLIAGGASLAASAVLPGLAEAQARKSLTLLNVSYDATRELYKDINPAFVDWWTSHGGKGTPTIQQSHGGSGKQGRAVIDGLEADVVTLALAYDIEQIATRAKLLPANWQSRLPNNATPYASTVAFLVRKGNPKGIRDWPDLVKPGVEVITPNPKTSGAARWNYLAAYAWALKQKGGSPATAEAYLGKLFAQAPVLDTSGRGATTTFAERGIGDVLVNWENEAYLALEEFGPKFEVVYPSLSILAEPAVALVDKNADAHGTRALAQQYLRFLYSPRAQDLIGKHHFRPRDPRALAKYRSKFKDIPLVTVDRVFGGWTKAQTTHFVDGGVFDRLYRR